MVSGPPLLNSPFPGVMNNRFWEGTGPGSGGRPSFFPRTCSLLAFDEMTSMNTVIHVRPRESGEICLGRSEGGVAAARPPLLLLSLFLHSGVGSVVVHEYQLGLSHSG